MTQQDERSAPGKDDLQRRVEALSSLVDTVEEDLQDELDTLRAEREELAERVDELEQELREVRTDVDRLDARTDMLELVEQANEMNATQRAATLLQHLARAARRQHDRGGDRRAAVNRDEAEEALHYPDVERTTIYRDMERVARLVGDETICWYADGELRLDLEAGDLPAQYRLDTTREEEL